MSAHQRFDGQPFKGRYPFMLSATSSSQLQSQIRAVTHPDRSILLVYLGYKLALTTLLWTLFFTGTGIGGHNPGLFTVAALSYLFINLFSLLLTIRSWQPDFKALLFIIGSDILLIQLMAFASGPFESGLGALMVISVAAGSIFISKHIALIVPAFATLTLFSSVIIRAIQSEAGKAEFVSSGWLGFSFFIASIAISYLADRMQAGEAKAELETQHAKSLQQLNALIIAKMQTGILILKSDGTIISSNKAAAALLHITNTDNVQHLEEIDNQIADFHAAVYTQSAHTIAERDGYSMLVTHNGLNLKLSWIQLSQASDAESLIFIEDLSKIAQQAQHLKLSSLGKLTASIAHEIRNPLGAASHAAQLLQDDAQTEEEKKLTRIIVEQTKRCSNIIASVLDVSRGKPSSVASFDLAEWLPGFLESYQIGKQADIRLDLSGSVPIRFDASHLGQIMTNLLDNALRYSCKHTGSKTALIRITQDADQRPRIDVIDFGQGVAQEHIGRLFEPFFTTGKMGSGLGLYICRELCEANQASIRYLDDNAAAHSENDQGYPGHCFRIQCAHPDRQSINLNIAAR